MSSTTANVNIRVRATGTKKARNEIRGIRSSLKGAASAAKSLAGPIAGIGAAFVFARAAKEAGNFHAAMSRLAIQANVTAGAQAEVTQQILDTSKASGIARDDLQGFLKSVTDMTGDLNVATSTMDAVAKASIATGADMTGLGFVISDLGGKFGLMGKDATDALGVMIRQGEMGRLTLEEMARIGPEVMSVAGAAGLLGKEGAREMGAFLQVMRRGFGTAEKTATGFRAVIQRLTSSEGLRKLQKFGIDPSGFQDATGALTDFRGLFLSVLQRSTEDAKVLADLFGEQALAAEPFRQLISGPGGIQAVEAELDKFKNVQADTTAIEEKFNRAIQDGSVQTARFKTRMTALATEVFFTKDKVDAFGVALDAIATGLETAVTSIEKLSTAAAEAAEFYGLLTGKPTAGQTAAGTAKMTPQEVAARQALGGFSLAEPGQAMTPNMQKFSTWLDGQPELKKSLQPTVGERAFGGTERGELRDLLKSDPEKYAQIAKEFSSEIKLDVTVHGADAGATVDAKDKKSGKIVPSGGAK